MNTGTKVGLGVGGLLLLSGGYYVFNENKKDNVVLIDTQPIITQGILFIKLTIRTVKPILSSPRVMVFKNKEDLDKTRIFLQAEELNSLVVQNEGNYTMRVGLISEISSKLNPQQQKVFVKTEIHINSKPYSKIDEISLIDNKYNTALMPKK